jgi:putative two-component system response regulator
MNNTTVKTQHVYVIDDNHWHNILMKKMLEMKGYVVSTFTNSINLLEQIREQPPELIISDIEMPEMNGFELFNEIQKIPAAKEVPLFYISSNTQKRITEEVKTTGAAGFVQKPIELDSLLKTVAQNCN